MTAGPKSPIASANAAVPHDARTPPGTPSHGVSDGIDGHSRKPRFCRRGAALCVTACVLFGITSLCHHALKSGGIHEDFVRNIPSSYARPPRQGVRTGRANDFVVHFRHALRYNMTSPVPTWQSLFSSQQLPPSNPTVKTQQHAVPFLLKDGKLLCRRAHISMLSGPNRIPILSRSKALVEMIRAGLDRQKEGTHFSHELSIGLPFLVMNGDHSGCDPALKSDRFHFPRLAWSYPSPEIVPGDWCKTIPAPSYVSWRDFKGKESETGWSNEFSSLSEKYPWSGKLDKAVWRGSTTAYGGPFGGKTVNETPRGQLVRIGTENPELFDVGFTRMNSRFAPQNDTQIALAAPLPFNDFMKYKAILDIDGNDWSSRFPMLLCSNSVIVKIAPLYIEHFYNELTPNVHYVPASLENLTQVTAYVLREDNEDEMKRIVESSNSWCQRKMTKEGMAKDAMMQLEKLDDAFGKYMRREGYDESTPLVPDDVVDDIVECIL